MRPSTVCAALVLAATTGCVRESDVPAQAVADGPIPVAEPLVERQLTVAPEEAPPPRPAVTSAASFPADPVPFQIGAAYGALSRVELADCAERGLPSGYLHVRATFTGIGTIVRASVASTTAPPPQALDCIADRLRQTGVPAFDGNDAKLSKTYFVEPSSMPPAPPAPVPSAGHAAAKPSAD